jgi:hypothetical protein
MSAPGNKRRTSDRDDWETPPITDPVALRKIAAILKDEMQHLTDQEKKAVPSRRDAA